MKLLRIFLFLAISSSFLAAKNIDIDDVGRVFLILENQSDSIVKAEISRNGGHGVVKYYVDSFSMQKGDSKIFSLESLFRKNWRSEQTQLVSTKWNIEFLIEFFNNDGNSIFEFVCDSKIEKRVFNLKQEVVSSRFSLIDSQKIEILSQDYLNKLFSFDEANIYIVKIVFTKIKPELIVNQKVLKIGENLSEFKF